MIEQHYSIQKCRITIAIFTNDHETANVNLTGKCLMVKTNKN